MGKISPLSENIKLNLTIVSDTHIDIKHPVPAIPKNLLKCTIKEAQKSKSRVDAYISVGDTTSRGSEINWKMTADCFKGYTPADSVLLTIGNHDCWDDGGYDDAYARFVDYTEKICGFRPEKPYFSKVIKGYHLIFLGNDADAGCEANIGDEQFAWFCGELKAAGESGKPVFVFCHQSLNGKHGLPRTWDKDDNPNRPADDGGVGARSAEIEAEMKKYKNVFYFSGHSHMGFSGVRKKQEKGYSSIEDDEGVTLINLPSLACGNHHGDINALGMGMQVEVYENRVVLRPRWFRKHKWIESIELKDGKPYYEVVL